VSIETLIAENASGDTTLGNIGQVIDPTPIVQAEQTSAIDYLNGVAARLRELNLTVDIEHPEGNAADAIVDRARALGVNLILMTTHGRGGLGRAVFGSVADSVIRHSPCPVLLIRVQQD
jgi:nucleotide-binding universal stress UspA family protein